MLYVAVVVGVAVASVVVMLLLLLRDVVIAAAGCGVVPVVGVAVGVGASSCCHSACCSMVAIEASSDCCSHWATLSLSRGVWSSAGVVWSAAGVEFVFGVELDAAVPLVGGSAMA